VPEQRPKVGAVVVRRDKEHPYMSAWPAVVTEQPPHSIDLVVTPGIFAPVAHCPTGISGTPDITIRNGSPPCGNHR